MARGPILIVARRPQELAARRRLPVVAIGRREFDLEKHDDIANAVAAVAPSAIINTAAFTAADRAESQEASAFSVNRDGAAALAAAAAQFNIPMIHLSTDYLFDGRKRGPL
jgi:dTDP-4-dehydrorhamnose reductase